MHLCHDVPLIFCRYQGATIYHCFPCLPLILVTAPGDGNTSASATSVVCLCLRQCIWTIWRFKGYTAFIVNNPNASPFDWNLVPHRLPNL